jgi:hypothetical protein
MKTIKVQRKYVKRQLGHDIVPEIRISGKWLKEQGITIGSYIHVCIAPTEKTIKNPRSHKQIKILNI